MTVRACKLMAPWDMYTEHIVEPLDQYLRTFSWNKVKYRADKPIADLIDLLQKVRSESVIVFKPAAYSPGVSQEVNGIGNDVKAKFNQYNSTKTNLTVSQRKQTYVSTKQF